MFERIEHPAQGRGGGRAGARGRVSLLSGQELQGKDLQSIPPNSRLILETLGGGGYGNPRPRAPEQLQQDISFELVSRQAAAVDYG
jgi:N-methylhydantoinase B